MIKQILKFPALIAIGCFAIILSAMFGIANIFINKR
jgi:hypothetical protein